MGWERNLIRKIMRVGESTVVAIPPPVIKEMELKAGEYLVFKQSTGGTILLRADQILEKGLEYRKICRFSKKRNSLKVTIPWKIARHFFPMSRVSFFHNGLTWCLKPA